MVKLWKHQEQAVQNALLVHNYALFFEMGAGKTGTVIEILKRRFNAAGRIFPTLIFTLPLPVPQWREEWLRFTKVEKKKVVLLQGAGKVRLTTFLKEIEKDPNKIFITNWESLLMADLFKAFKAWGPEAVVFDESHKIKSHTSKKGKLSFDVANLGKVKPYTYILTGSPVLNSPMDLFQQFKVLDGGKTFGANFFAFRGRYFRDRNAGMPSDRHFPDWQIMTLEKDGVDGLAEIQKRMEPISMRVLKEDCLDLPPEVSVPTKVLMSKEQERLYNEMKKDLVTYYDSKACVATMAITKVLRLLQITAGFISLVTPDTEEGKVEKSFGQTPKLDALEELLENIVEQGEKVLVWAVWKYNYGQIREVCDRLKIKYVEVHGDISNTQKLANVELFKHDPEVRVLIGHPLSGGIGLNLTVASYSIFYSRTHRLEEYLQARARNHRGGAKEAGHERITHYDLICENTIDEAVLQKLANKEDMSNTLLDSIIDKLR